MIRDILRTLGTGCLLAGGVLYVTNSVDNSAGTDLRQAKQQINQLQSELDITKQELAIAQTTSSLDQKHPIQTNDNLPNDDSSTTPSPSHHILTIEPGSNSTIVSAALEKAGLIENAEEFNAYLARNGLSGKIQIGDHEINTSMDYSAIARKITTSQ